MRQALGKAALDVAKRRNERVTEDILHDIESTVSKISPHLSSPSGKAKTGLDGLVKLAVEFRNEMTVEHAIYSCHWFSASEEIKVDSKSYDFEAQMEAEDGVPSALCVQPALVRRIKEEDVIDEVILVAGKVILD
jgi:hypothetical protein